MLLRNLGDKHVVFHALGEHIKSTENQFRPKTDIAAACSFRNALSKRVRSIFDRTKVVPYTPIFCVLPNSRSPPFGAVTRIIQADVLYKLMSLHQLMILY